MKYSYQKLEYRKDIDGLRALSVIAVVLYHMHYFRFGYLGVDVFFVISGFLITSILYTSIQNHTLSIRSFYNRRIRRIVPLVLLINIWALIFGILLMLPYDLDKLVQSIIATSIFGNNLLELYTTMDYWSPSNDYKPLMHTWSLAIEEQFYLFYPFVFFLFRGSRSKFILPFLLIGTLISLALLFNASNQYRSFYLLGYRFYELSLGGVLAISLIKYKPSTVWSSILALISVILFIVWIEFANDRFLLLAVVFGTLFFLSNKVTGLVDLFKPLLENQVLVFIGKMSFSLYMWHQLVLAFLRYGYFEKLLGWQHAVVGVLLFGLSYLSYKWVEAPFRNAKRVNNRTFYTVIGMGLLLVNLIAGFIYLKGGVIRAVPELELEYGEAYRNMHLDYNTQHVGLESNFKDVAKPNMVIVGNSFARDWINVMWESSYRDKFEYYYRTELSQDRFLITKLKEADAVFISSMNKQRVKAYFEMNRLDFDKVHYIGIKNFGVSNGIYYNAERDGNYCNQTISLSASVLTEYENEKKMWAENYIDLVEMVRTSTDVVPVFTPECKYISQDCMHFTPAGAQYYADLIESQKFPFSFERLLSDDVME